MKSALIIVDMQRFFGKMMENPLPHIKRLHALFDINDWPVFFTQHGHTPDELIPPIKSQLIRKLGAEHVLMAGTRDWELIPDVWKMTKDATVVEKNTYDAFQNTDLHDLLQKAGVERLVVCGVLTDVCCHTTARSGFTKDYESWLISDACGTENEERHKRALKSAEDVLIDVMTTEGAIARLKAE